MKKDDGKRCSTSRSKALHPAGMSCREQASMGGLEVNVVLAVKTKINTVWQETEVMYSCIVAFSTMIR